MDQQSKVIQNKDGFLAMVGESAKQFNTSEWGAITENAAKAWVVQEEKFQNPIFSVGIIGDTYRDLHNLALRLVYEYPQKGIDWDFFINEDRSTLGIHFQEFFRVYKMPMGFLISIVVSEKEIDIVSGLTSQAAIEFLENSALLAPKGKKDPVRLHLSDLNQTFIKNLCWP